MSPFVRIAAAAVFGVSALSTARAEVERRPLQIDLVVKGVPANAAATSPIAGAGERNIALRVEDGRGAEAGAVIGQGVNDGTVVYPILAKNDVGKYVEEVTRNVLSGWGLKLGDGTDGSLLIRYTKFNVAHNNRAVGATYVGDVTIAYSLTNRAGRILASGSFSGNVDHYGRGRSAEACNEALSEALADALSKLSNDTNFRKVWSTSPAVTDAPPPGKAARPAASAPEKPAANVSSKSLESRLHKLDGLYKSGAISKDEYDKRRGEILSEI